MPMSERDTKGYVREGRSFEDDREEFLKEIYRVEAQRNDDLRIINLENRQFYELKDKILEQRALNPNVKRSAIFVPELTQAVDARVGSAVAKLEQSDPAMVCRPRGKNAPAPVKDAASEIGVEIYQQMRDCGYLPDIFEEHSRSAEIHRTPSVLKIFWRHDQKEVPVKRKRQPMGLMDAMRMLMPGGLPEEVVWERQDQGSPWVQWLHPEDFLYEQSVSSPDEMRYMGHRMWLEYDELIALAAEQGYDMKKIRAYREECQAAKGEETAKDSMRDEEQTDKETPWDVGYRDNKYLVIEWYVKTFDEAGNKQMNLCVMLGNKYLIKDGAPDHKGFDFPFVFLVLNRLPGTMEGLSSIDRGKGLQRAYNEEYNSHFDLMSYGLFTPFKNRRGNQFEKAPVWEPGAIWYIDDPEELQPAMPHPMRMTELGPSIDALGQKIRNLLGAEDIDQGFQANPYEKATSTKMRALGSAKRELPTMKKYGRVVIRVAEMFLALDQQFHPEKERFVVEGGVWFDVPALTADSDPEMEKQELFLLLSTFVGLPMYQGPVGMPKIANIIEDIARRIKRSDWADFGFTPQEVQMLVQQMVAQQQAMIEKQDAQERIQMLSAQTPEAQPQGAK